MMQPEQIACRILQHIHVLAELIHTALMEAHCLLTGDAFLNLYV